MITTIAMILVVIVLSLLLAHEEQENRKLDKKRIEEYWKDWQRNDPDMMQMEQDIKETFDSIHEEVWH